MRIELALVASCVLLCATPAGAVQERPEPRLSIGTADGPAEEAFGQIRDVAVDEAGNVFVLDNQTLEIRWFDGNGQFRGSAGGAGSGPGRLRGPQRLSVPSSAEVAVLDPLNGRISRYRHDEEGLTHMVDIDAPPAFDFCTIDGSFYLLRLQPDSVVTVVSPDGAIVSAWGTLIEPLAGHELPPEEIRVELDNRARMYCDEGSRTITLLYDRIPTVRRFSSTGDTMWEIELDDYSRVRDVPTPDESGWMAAPDPATGLAHSGRSITRGADGALAITLYEGSETGGRYELRILSAATGEELGRETVPMIVTAVRDDLMTGYVNQPVPRVLRFDGPALLRR
jgi:hypothetical protein